MKTSLLTYTLRTALMLTFTPCASLTAGYVTLTVNSNTPQESITIRACEVAEVVAFPRSSHGSPLEITKNGMLFRHDAPRPRNSEGPADPFEPIVVSGPATITLRDRGWTGYPASSCTLRISPEAFPADKSIIVYPGSGGASVTMEYSTNLIHWFAAKNGVYTNLNEARFFRIKAEAIPASP